MHFIFSFSSKCSLFLLEPCREEEEEEEVEEAKQAAAKNYSRKWQCSLNFETDECGAAGGVNDIEGDGKAMYYFRRGRHSLGSHWSEEDTRCSVGQRRSQCFRAHQQ